MGLHDDSDHGDVLLLTLNRSDRLNAWNDALEERYFALLDAAEADPAVRAVVLSGAGRGCCAGADFEDLQRLGAADLGITALPVRERPRERPLAFRKPLIAAINGAAAGLGLVEALYCDVRFCMPEAKFTTAFAQRGLIAEYGVAWLLPRLVGQSNRRRIRHGVLAELDGPHQGPDTARTGLRSGHGRGCGPADAGVLPASGRG